MNTIDCFEMLSDNLYMMEGCLEEVEHNLSMGDDSVNAYILRQQKDRLTYQIDTVKFLIVELAERAAKEKHNDK